MILDEKKDISYKSETLKIPVKNIPSNFKVMRTLDDGNCFYSSIYRNAKHVNLLNKIFECIPELNANNETTFIKNFRNYVSYNINHKITKMFYHLSNIVENYDTDNFDSIINQIGDIKDIIIEYKEYGLFSPEYLNDFILDIKNIIKTDKKYVGQLEVDFIKEKLDDCDIYINIFYNENSAIEKMKQDYEIGLYKDSLYFINMDEVHYVYIIEDK
jgi:hypothetical protein